MSPSPPTFAIISNNPFLRQLRFFVSMNKHDKFVWNDVGSQWIMNAILWPFSFGVRMCRQEKSCEKCSAQNVKTENQCSTIFPECEGFLKPSLQTFDVQFTAWNLFVHHFVSSSSTRQRWTAFVVQSGLTWWRDGGEGEAQSINYLMSRFKEARLWFRVCSQKFSPFFPASNLSKKKKHPNEENKSSEKRQARITSNEGRQKSAAYLLFRA